MNSWYNQGKVNVKCKRIIITLKNEENNKNNEVILQEVQNSSYNDGNLDHNLTL